MLNVPQAKPASQANRLNSALAMVLLVAMAGCATSHPQQPAAGQQSFDTQHAIAATQPCDHDHLVETVAPSAPDSQVVQVNRADGWQRVSAMVDRFAKSPQAVPTTTLLKSLKAASNALEINQTTLPKVGLTKLSADQMFKQTADGVVLMIGGYLCSRCSKIHASPASGFIISSDGLAVTNYHVVDNDKNKTMLAMTRDGKLHAVQKVLAADKSEDWAVVQLDNHAGKVKFKPIPLSGTAPVGATVRVISHPNRRFYTLTEGIVSRYAQETYHGKQVLVQQITAAYGKGSSGAPVINEYGAVVGIVSRTSSLYYTVEKGVQKNLQMVFRTCVPVKSILDKIQPGDSPLP